MNQDRGRVSPQAKGVIGMQPISEPLSTPRAGMRLTLWDPQPWHCPCAPAMQMNDREQQLQLFPKARTHSPLHLVSSGSKALTACWPGQFCCSTKSCFFPND